VEKVDCLVQQPWDTYADWKRAKQITKLPEIVMTSPPWNVLDGQASNGDAELSKRDCSDFANLLFRNLGKNSVVIIHMSPSPDNMVMERMKKAMTKRGWIAYKAVFVQPTKMKPPSHFNQYQPQRNALFFIVFHKSGDHPKVARDFLLQYNDVLARTAVDQGSTLTSLSLTLSHSRAISYRSST
jgi:hypothetical protein